jgi:hypothetical protein
VGRALRTLDEQSSLSMLETLLATASQMRALLPRNRNSPRPQFAPGGFRMGSCTTATATGSSSGVASSTAFALNTTGAQWCHGSTSRMRSLITTTLTYTSGAPPPVAHRQDLGNGELRAVCSNAVGVGGWPAAAKPTRVPETDGCVATPARPTGLGVHHEDGGAGDGHELQGHVQPLVASAHHHCTHLKGEASQWRPGGRPQGPAVARTTLPQQQVPQLTASESVGLYELLGSLMESQASSILLMSPGAGQRTLSRLNSMTAVGAAAASAAVASPVQTGTVTCNGTGTGGGVGTRPAAQAPSRQLPSQRLRPGGAPALTPRPPQPQGVAEQPSRLHRTAYQALTGDAAAGLEGRSRSRHERPGEPLQQV